MKIAVNVVALRSAGGRSVALNFLRAVQKQYSTYQLEIFAAANCGYEEFESIPHFNLHYVPQHFTNLLLRPYLDHVWLRNKIIATSPDVVFSMGNMALPRLQNQVVLFHWAYATHPECEIWGRMSWKDAYIRKAKVRAFRNRLKYASIVAAQTETSASRLKKYYPDIGRVEIVPNPVALEGFNYTKRTSQNKLIQAHSARRKKLLCLSRYYPHKNLEILLDLGDIIKAENKPYTIITTIAANQHPNAARFLDEINRRGLGSIVLNLGPVPMDEVPGVYESTDGLILPTLLESFSGTYVDAMNHGKPVFTSDRDFAHEVCGDAAFYFDPLSARSIVGSLDKAFNSDALLNKKLNAGKERVMGFPDWNEVACRYLRLLEQVAGKQGQRVYTPSLDPVPV